MSSRRPPPSSRASGLQHRPDRLFAVPVPVGQLGDQPLRIAGVEDEVVLGHPGLVQQRLGLGGVGDGLEMGEAVRQPVQRLLVPGQLIGAFGRGHDRQRVEDHRGRPVQLRVGRDLGPAGQLDRADLGRHHHDRGLRRLGRGLERVDHGPVGAVSHQDAQLAALGRRHRLLEDRQLVRHRQVDRRDRGLGRRRQRHRHAVGHALRQRLVDVAQMRQHPLADMDQRDLGQLEHQRRDDMALFDVGQRAEEHPRLAVVVGEGLGPDAQLFGRRLAAQVGDRARGDEAAAGVCAGAAHLARLVQRVRLVIGAALGDLHLHHPVALEVVHRAARRVDRDLVEVRRPQPRFLRVQIAEQPPLQQRVVREVDPRRHVGRAEGDLFVFREVVVHVAVQGHRADQFDRHLFLGDQLGGVQHVIGLLLGPGWVDHLDAQVPLREVALGDRLEQVAAVIVVVGALQLGRFVPQQRLDPQARLPVEADKG